MSQIDQFYTIAQNTALNSPCKKRQVGAVLVGRYNRILSTGFNQPGAGESNCEDSLGNTRTDVIHAEVDAILNSKHLSSYDDTVMYVTHKPCDKCVAMMDDLGIKYQHKSLSPRNPPKEEERRITLDDTPDVPSGFTKADNGKNRLELVCPEFIEGLGSVLTMGAIKYSADNWKKASPEDQERIKGALLRHLMEYLKGNKLDDESGLSHLYHAGFGLMVLDHFDRTETCKS